MSQQTASGATQNGALGGLLNEMMTAARLTFDGRVPMYLKLLLPVAAALYWIWPIDLMPFDDIAVLVVALHFFVQLANQALEKQQGPTAQTAPSGDGAVVDTTWRRID
jgi:uncharacterized membrane protein YkvA (DUF1232 family)